MPQKKKPGDKSSGVASYSLRPREARVENIVAEEMDGNREDREVSEASTESAASGRSSESEASGSTVTYAKPGGDLSAGDMMMLLLNVMKESREDRKREDEVRRREDERRMKLEEDRIRLEEMRLKDEDNRRKKEEDKEKAREEELRRLRQEDIERVQKQIEEDRLWKECMAKEKNKKDKLQQALRTFPKISSASTLPTQLQNFSLLMDSLGVEDGKKLEKLPEVLSGQMAIAFHNMAKDNGMPFSEVQKRLLAVAGLTAMGAGKAFLKPEMDHLNKMSAVESGSYMRSILERMFGEASDKEDMLAVCYAMFLGVFGNHNMITALSSCDTTKWEEVLQVSYRCYEVFGAIYKNESKSSVRRNEFGYKQKSWDRPKCETCGKVGHKSDNCWHREEKPKVTCYACNEAGHYSSQCPNKSANGNSSSSKGKVDEKVKTVKKTNMVKKVCDKQEGDNFMSVVVEGKEVRMLVDSGADISVVPPEVVGEECYTGEFIELTDFEGLLDRPRRIAVVEMRVGGHVFSERVAVSTHLGGKGLLRLSLRDEECLTKVLGEFFSQCKTSSVCSVQTRAQQKSEIGEIEEEFAQLEEEQIVLNDVIEESEDEVQEEEEVNVVDIAEDVCEQDEDEEVVEKEPELEEPVVLDCVLSGNDRDKFVNEVKDDTSLAVCKRLASNKERGYSWDHGVLLHTVLEPVHGECMRIVLPKSRREAVLGLAHDKMGHLGFRKVKSIVSKRFTWPNIGIEVEKYCASCSTCQKANRAGQRKVPMVERPVVTEPFESVAIDIVGPLPVTKGKYRFLLTTICLATRWPDVVPLKAVTARAVADALLQIFSRTGLPLVLLSDNGSQFKGKLMSELLSILEVDIRHTTPYHPQCNGVVERMHGTLEGMLRKACANGGDWVEQLPFALFALRQMPNKTTGFSPYELVWGKVMRTPLDVVYSGWKEKECVRMNVSEWAMKLCDKLEVMKDWAVSRGVVESRNRKVLYDRGKVVRTLEVGDKIWVRIPGRASKLEDAWEGPLIVCKKVSDVNYRVCEEGKKKSKVIHINSAKKFVERVSVCSVTVLAEEKESESSYVKLGGEVNDNVLSEVNAVLEDFVDIMDGTVGVYNGEQVRISVDEGAEPVSKKPYRIPDALKSKVKEAVDQLIRNDWVEETDSPWGSPIVPVSKPDGSIRLCVNYKCVNSVTKQIQFPIPHFDDLMVCVGSASVLSKLDLMKGYYQIPLEDGCRDLTAFVTPWGTYRFKVLPFGLKNAPAIFQKIMKKILRKCEEFAVVYIDDVLVFSEEESSHSRHVSEVLEVIRQSGLKVNPKKCEWARSRVEFLGHVVGNGKVSVPEARVEALRRFRQPKSRKDIKVFLGTMGYYRKFIPKYADMSSVLSPATSANAPGLVAWTPEMVEAFESLRKSLCNVCMLNVPVHGDVFVLHTDASGRGVGGVLYVVRSGKELPVAFYSRQLQGAERRYSATELEALAVVKSVEHFVPYLYGRSFTVVTDHAPLVYLMSSKVLNRRLRGFMLRLLEFDVDIVYRPGVDNADADGLSRQAWDEQKQSTVDAPIAFSLGSSSAGGDVGTST